MVLGAIAELTFPRLHSVVMPIILVELKLQTPGVAMRALAAVMAAVMAEVAAEEETEPGAQGSRCGGRRGERGRCAPCPGIS